MTIAKTLMKKIKPSAGEKVIKRIKIVYGLEISELAWQHKTRKTKAGPKKEKYFKLTSTEDS